MLILIWGKMFFYITNLLANPYIEKILFGFISAIETLRFHSKFLVATFSFLSRKYLQIFSVKDFFLISNFQVRMRFWGKLLMTLIIWTHLSSSSERGKFFSFWFLVVDLRWKSSNFFLARFLSNRIKNLLIYLAFTHI